MLTDRSLAWKCRKSFNDFLKNGRGGDISNLNGGGGKRERLYQKGGGYAMIPEDLMGAVLLWGSEWITV